MAQLITIVIAIALGAVLASSSVFFGGDAYNNGAAKASATELVNKGSQIAASFALSVADNAGVAPADLATLVSDEYLREVPAMPRGFTGSYTLHTENGVDLIAAPMGADGLEICEWINNSADGTKAPTAVEEATSAVDLGAALDRGSFGCFQDNRTTPALGATTGDYVFFYKR